MAITRSHPIYVQLKQILISERIISRHSLSIEELAHKLNASSIPIREALIRLSAEDLIDHEFGKGFFTKELNIRSVEENYTIFFQLAKWCLDSYDSNRGGCNAFLEWIDSDPHYFEKLKADDALFELTIHRCMMCIAGPLRYTIVGNIIQRTAHFRKFVFPQRIDIAATATDIITISRLLLAEKRRDAREVFNELETRRLNSIAKEFEQLLGQQIDFPNFDNCLVV